MHAIKNQQFFDSQCPPFFWNKSVLSLSKNEISLLDIYCENSYREFYPKIQLESVFSFWRNAERKLINWFRFLGYLDGRIAKLERRCLYYLNCSCSGRGVCHYCDLSFLWLFRAKIEATPTECFAKIQEAGFVYVVECNSTKKVKIGITKRSLAKRAKEFNTPGGVSFIRCFPSFDARKDETELHRIFQSDRARGEWFSLGLSSLNKIDEFFQGKQIPNFAELGI